MFGGEGGLDEYLFGQGVLIIKLQKNSVVSIHNYCTILCCVDGSYNSYTWID